MREKIQMIGVNVYFHLVKKCLKTKPIYLSLFQIFGPTNAQLVNN
ncbi:unnamed protein product, partial [Arabidopsis halleri]